MIITRNDEKALRELMYKRIEEELQDIRSGKNSAKRVVLVVPAQETLLTEEDSFNYLKEDGFFDFHVMSGARLREEVLKEVGKPKKTVIDSIGRNMLLRKIAKEKADELSGFKRICTEDGFIDLCGDMMVQLMQNEVTPSDLNRISLDSSNSEFLKTKLHDISILYDEYEKYMNDKFTDSENLLEYVISKIPESSFIHDSIIWYYDFYSFTKREYEFLSAIKTCAAEFNIAILSGSDKYLAGKLTTSKLSAKLKMSVDEKENEIEDAKQYRVMRCSSYYSQSETIANDILKLVREKSYSYSDFEVLAEDELMQENLRRYFESVGIPVFMDKKRELSHSLFARFVVYLLSICDKRWMPKDVLGLLRTSLLKYSDDDIEAFTNYVTQYKIYKDAFLSKFKYGKNDVKYETAERIRGEIVSLLQPFSEKVQAANTVKEKSVVVYEFLVDKIYAPDRLKELAINFEKEGFLDEAQELRQSFNIFISLLDQMVELIGDEVLSLSEYEMIISSSFKDIKIGVLPESDGKVIIGNVTRSSFSDIKALYICGFNEGLLPMNNDAEGMFTSREIERLEQKGINLVKNNSELDIEGLFQIDRVLDTACEYMCLCYCASDLGGNSMEISPLLSKFVSDKKLVIEDDDWADGRDLNYIQNKNTASLKLMESLKAYILGKELSPEWMVVSNTLKNDEKLAPIFDALFFNPVKQQIEKSIAKELFAKSRGGYLSPSQLEEYAACPFKHFIDKGLKPDEREVFESKATDTGTVYHLVLERLSERLSRTCVQKGIDITDPCSSWMTISDLEIENEVDSIIKEISEEELDGLLLSTSEESYKVQRLKKVAIVFAKYMIAQIRKGHVSEMHFENEFGEGKTLPPVYVDTSFGKIRVEGKVDRTDIIKTQSHEYVKVIDYKSGSKDFSKERIKLGLDLQLMIYLEAAEGEKEGLEAGGVFYYQIKNPGMDADFYEVIANTISKDLESKLAKKYALDGVMINDPAFLSSLDSEIDTLKPQTDVVTIRQNCSNIVSQEELETLRAEFRETIGFLCESLMSGNANVSPKVFKKEHPGCMYCKYAAICMRDLY